jgi:serine/alanine adding enzyme
LWRAGRGELPIALAASQRKITVVLDLPPEPDRLWRALNAKVRSQVRRPQKEGVQVRFGPDQLPAFFHVFSRHMRDLGTPTHARSLFEALATEFPDSTWFGVAYLGDQPISAGCGFHWRGEFELVWASSLREFNRIAPNMLLYWNFMERCITEGFRTFNFGRCTAGSGTHRFKQQWGGRDEPLWWYQRSRGRVTTPSPSDPAFQWGPRIWRRLPLPLATFIGPRVVRFIP